MEESVFKGISRLKKGDHALLIYNNAYEVADALIPFLEIGFKRNECCLVLQDEYSRVQLMPRLINAGVNLKEEEGLGRLKFIDSQAAYLKDGVFYIKKMIDFWESTLDNAHKAGYTALRVAGEANWAVKVPRNLKRFLAYEEEIGDLFAGSNILFLCIYYKHLFSKETLRKALDLHPLIIQGEKLHNNVLFKGRSFVQRELLESSDLDGYIHVLTNYSQLEQKKEDIWKKYLEFVTAIPAVTYRMSSSGAIEIINDHVKEITGYTINDYTEGKQSWINTIHPQDRENVFKQYTSRMEREKELALTYRILRKDGSILWVEDISHSIFIDGQFSHACGVVFDISEQRVVTEQLLNKNEELNSIIRNLHELTIKMATLEENEHRRLVEMLHDDICQSLVAIKMAFSTYRKGCISESKEKKKAISTIYSMLEEVINATRSITSELYTPNLEEMDLINILKWHIRSFMEPSGIKVILNCSNIEDLTSKLKDGIFRIIRECLHNILKHASASNVEVMCVMDNRGCLKLNIKDDGVGFSSGVEAEENKGIGLMLMRERVRDMNGKMKIKSRPGKGTELVVVIPVPPDKRARGANSTPRKLKGSSRRERVSP